MSHGAQVWDRFVGDGLRASAAIDDGLSAIRIDQVDQAADALEALAHHAFRIATGALLLGAEDVGRLAMACERGIDLLRRGELVADYGLPVLVSSAHTLRRGFLALASPDQSGARTDGAALEGARFELESLFPLRGHPSRAAHAGPDVPIAALRRPKADGDASEPAAAPEPAAGEDHRVWVPSVDDDMVELFFEEAGERIEELAQKLLEIEQRPGDVELLRDIFRDLHTIKGSSAMVALAPMNELAHAAEDLVGTLRDGERTADGPIVDALLAALDGLREVLAYARARQRIDTDFAPIVRRLQNPHAWAPGTSAAPAPIAERRPAARQTIRVDFDKLDRLMNLVGELVLGRDGLHGGIQSLSAVAEELSADRRLAAARRASSTRAAGGFGGRGRPESLRGTLAELGEELGRVERVLVDISQELGHASGRLDSVSAELRDQVMKLRMVPVGGVFRKHHRTVRDLGNQIGKRVKLELAGEETELDKLLVEALDEPLMHLIRNAVDHGIETPDARIAAGKPAEGTIRLSAAHRGNQMVIQIRDDGAGIDPEALRERARERDLLAPEELDALDDRQVLDIIFRPGFSTAERISEVSGRGVGMDVVRETIVTRLKGAIDIDSRLGDGTTFTLRLPLTLAIIQVLLARAGGEVFAIPLDSVARTLTCDPASIQLVQDRETMALGDRQVPLIRLAAILELDADPFGVDAELPVVLTEVGGELYGLVCDHLIGKKEIVIKSLGDVLESVPCAAGATLLGERCAIILDVPAIVGRAIRRAAPAPPQPRARRQAAEVAEDAPHILLVEDSDIVRESLRRLLTEAGYRVTVATDGLEGLELARQHHFDLISTDVMMPNMDGYELTRALRATAEYKDAPIVMVTSRGERIDRVRGFDAGVDEYITKPHDHQLLVRAVRKLLGQDEGGAP